MDSDWRVLPEQIIEGGREYVLEERYEWVDADRAWELLNYSIGNRDIGGPVLANLVADMKSGTDFKRLEEPVQLDSDGKLMNAHHRLTAIVQAKHPQFLRIVRGFPSSYYKYMDQSRARNAADTLYVEQVDNPRMVARTLRLLEQINQSTRTKDFRMRNSHVSELHDRLADTSASIEFGRIACEEVKVQQQTYAVSHYIYDRVDPKKAKSFWDIYLNGPRHDKLTAPNALFYELNRQVNEKQLARQKRIQHQITPVEVCIDIHDAWMHRVPDEPLDTFEAKQVEAWQDLASTVQSVLA